MKTLSLFISCGVLLLLSPGCNKVSGGSSASGASTSVQGSSTGPSVNIGTYDGIDASGGLAYITLYGSNLTASGATGLMVSSSCATMSVTQGAYVYASPTQINASFTLPAQQQPGCEVTLSYEIGSSTFQTTVPINIPGSGQGVQSGFVCTFSLNSQMGSFSAAVGTAPNWQVTTNAAAGDTLDMTMIDQNGPIAGYTDIPGSGLLSSINGDFQQNSVSSTPYNRSIIVTDQTTGATCTTNTLYVTVTI